MKFLTVIIVVLAGSLAAEKIPNSRLIGDGFECKTYDFEIGKVSGCQLTNGADLTQAINGITVHYSNMLRRNERCDGYADWTLDQNGNVMYRVKNGDCPNYPKPHGYGNYCYRDLESIGKGDIPESARPRTPGCK